MKLLKFGAVWCSGCLVMRPRMQKILAQYDDLDSPYYDYDENKEYVSAWKVDDRLPTFIFVDKDGVELMRLHGEVKEKKMIELIEKYKDQ